MTNEIEVVPVPETSMALSRPPEVVLAEAKKAATALQGVIKGKARPVIFNGQQYLEFEDWQVLARFYGLTAKVINTEPVEFGEVRGFKSKAVVLDIKTGQEISAAESMCLNDEGNWSARKGKPVPMFQLMSMSQTRSCAKALRNVLAWVVVLAGYKPTPAEEITGTEGHASRPAPSMPKATPPKAATETTAEPTDGPDGSGNLPEDKGSPEATSEPKISDKQRKRFYAIWKNSGKSEEVVKDMLMACIGTTNTADIPVNRYEELCLWAESK